MLPADDPIANFGCPAGDPTGFREGEGEHAKSNKPQDGEIKGRVNGTIPSGEHTRNIAQTTEPEINTTLFLLFALLCEI